MGVFVKNYHKEMEKVTWDGQSLYFLIGSFKETVTINLTQRINKIMFDLLNGSCRSKECLLRCASDTIFQGEWNRPVKRSLCNYKITSSTVALAVNTYFSCKTRCYKIVHNG